MSWNVLRASAVSFCTPSDAPECVRDAGLIVTWAFMLNVMVTYKQKLTAFMTDMLSEGDSLASVPKVD